MRELTFREVQLKELEILFFFDELCKKNNIKYYLCGGTLLGAIRHKGFIPWDDDIDVCMPRRDYEKLLLIEFSSERYVLQNNKFGNLKRAITKVVDIKTHTTGFLEEDKNLWIDIFPIDGLPENEKEVEKIYQKTYYYRKILYVCGSKLGLGRSIIKKYLLYILKPIANFFWGVDKCVEKINEIALCYPYDKENYVGAIVGGIYGVGERMPKDEFENVVEVEFEKRKFPTFSCWHQYLSGCYGNYMQLPPLEKRKNHIRKVFCEE